MPTYEFAYSRVVSTTADKISGMLRDGDKMSGLGWELKGIFDDVSGVVMFWQRESVPPSPLPSDVPTPPQMVARTVPTSVPSTAPVTTNLIRQILPAKQSGQPSVVVLRK